MEKKSTDLSLGPLRIGEISLLEKALKSLPQEEQKGVLYNDLVKRLKMLSKKWKKLEKTRKNQRQTVIQSKAFKKVSKPK